jgi:hypothetical protein
LTFKILLELLYLVDRGDLGATVESQMYMGGWIPDNTHFKTLSPKNAFKNEQKTETAEDDHEEL